MDTKDYTNFTVTVYGEMKPVSPVLTQARVRIFYKYKNRNQTFINDDFAEKLISSLAYVPVKGIYDRYEEDYTDHGAKRSLGRIYGIVPENHNFAWEKHIDGDGIEREYACCDVLLYTGLYEEASQIIDKPQSMELYEKTLKYHFEEIDGQKWVVFDDGCFLGLQALGDEVEPCFEGASFYELNKLQQAINEVLSYQKKQGGQDIMPKLNFKLSDSQKFDAIWEKLNDNYNQDGNWTIGYSLLDVYDDYALAYNYETNGYERVFYTKGEDDTIEITDKHNVYILEISEAEKSVIDTLRLLNGETFTVVSDVLANANENIEKIESLSNEIVERDNSIATLNTEKDEIVAQYDAQIASLQSEIDTLTQYKLDIENAQKEAVLAEYSNQLTEEVIDEYRSKLDEFTAVELDKELAYVYKKSNPDVFSSNFNFVPKDEPKSGLDAILENYVIK